jgi:hypothetical protein
LLRAFLVAALRPGFPLPFWSPRASRVRESRPRAA